MHIHFLIKRLAGAIGVYRDAVEPLPEIFVRIWTGNDSNATGDPDDPHYVDLPIKEVWATWGTPPVLVVDQTKLPRFEADATARGNQDLIERLKHQANKLSGIAAQAHEHVLLVDSAVNRLNVLAGDLASKTKGSE